MRTIFFWFSIELTHLNCLRSLLKQNICMLPIILILSDVNLWHWLAGCWKLKIYFERLNFHLSQTTLLLPSSLSMKLSGIICLCSLLTTQLVLIRYIPCSMIICPLQKNDFANPIYFLFLSGPTSCWILSRRLIPIEMVSSTSNKRNS